MSRISVLFGIVVPLNALSAIFIALRLVSPLQRYISWNATDLAWWNCRFYCRHFIVRRVGLDDWIMLIALVCFFDSLGFVSSELLLMWMVGEFMGYRSVLESYITPCMFPPYAAQVF